ncbi:citrate lyase subunit gamma (acyl carrier protein) [Sporomusaceae bacterium BoRhaA]|uniref:citrate lyase acyl carrier protein n=1 Tax=Pelorhabdus rhamnosifermentans TaxID=2772457 RepID=UPI001C0609A4|nr:citrate lyase acyl carrier protein [Pelorhabdus rhamnosifermentans]MBU2702866.1 citrate lyase subunit gamma (acyl carrier protein) [Pelorhabdus rhamnosifermentans]
MSQIKKMAIAGTMESNDILITVAPAAAGAGIAIELTSPVLKQYGRQMKAIIEEVLAEHHVTDAVINGSDKGALDCTIKARLITALERAGE